MNSIHVLFNGYCKIDDINKQDMLANCTCTLIKSQNDIIIVDTMTAWDGNNIIESKTIIPNNVIPKYDFKFTKFQN